MKTASVSELKSRISEFLRLVRGGDTVMVTDRGRPVALLEPYERAGAAQGVPGAHGADSADSTGDDLTELRDAGLVRIGSGKLPADFWTRPRPQDPEGSLVAAVLEEREEGW
jgi:prevent-host-death family protein